MSFAGLTTYHLANFVRAELPVKHLKILAAVVCALDGLKGVSRRGDQIACRHGYTSGPLGAWE
jgi:hypothetical protein